MSVVSSSPAADRPPVPPSSRFTPRQMLGGAMLLGLCLALCWGALALVEDDPRVSGALRGGLMAAAATALGTLPVLLAQRISQRASDAMLGFGAGVMLAASAFSLILPALRAATEQGAGPWAAGGLVGAGLLLGGLFLLAADIWVPQDAFANGLAGLQAQAMKRAWLFVLAISLHNLPEGLAIGVAYGGVAPGAAQALATGISIQDVPEGLVVALALRGVGYGRGRAVLLGIASGLVEPVMAVLGAAAISYTAGLLPWGLAFAGGAMLFAVSHEAIPGAHEQGHRNVATVGLMLGFVLMMLLDTALG